MEGAFLKLTIKGDRDRTYLVNPSSCRTLAVTREGSMAAREVNPTWFSFVDDGKLHFTSGFIDHKSEFVPLVSHTLTSNEYSVYIDYMKKLKEATEVSYCELFDIIDLFNE